MKEIKFRALAQDNDIGVFDCYAIDLERKIALHSNGEWYNYIELIQFTGLKDKKEKEVYEKDIIANKDGKGNIIWKGIVEWSNEGAEYKIILINSKEKYAWRVLGTGTKDTYPYGEVIGNIYENPELLK